ncbi:MAG: response regulator [Thermodesulfobacteriota bacterium]
MEIEQKKILIVDDNLELAQVIAQLLRKEGYEPSIAEDGKTALAEIQNGPLDMVLLDLQLPDIKGDEILKKIKTINEDTAVIILTAYGNEQIAVELMKAGAEDFVSKPFDNAYLLNSIREVFKMQEAKKEEKKLTRLSSLEKLFPFLAHEIRNPLHAISGALAIIQRRSNLQDEILAKSIKIIQEEVQHLSGFVQECLDFIRPPLRSRYTLVDINEVMAVVINILGHIYEDFSKRINIRQECQAGIPKILVNYEEIKQAFMNILKNSIEAISDSGEIFINTSFSPEPSPGWLRVVVVDNGPGIKKNNKDYLFQPFFTTKIRGTGLGLAICRRIIVERHDGRIWLESEEGKGTKVVMELPAKRTFEPGSERAG